MTNINEILRNIEEQIDNGSKSWLLQTLPTGEKKTYVIHTWMEHEVIFAEYDRESRELVGEIKTIETYNQIKEIITAMEGTVVFSHLILV